MQHSAGSSPTPLSSFLDDLVCQIPLNQRGYAWTKGRVDDLIYDCLTERKLGRQSHFIGSVLFAYLERDGERVWSVEDGQQRLTTSFLIIKAVEEELSRQHRAFVSLLSSLDTGGLSTSSVDALGPLFERLGLNFNQDELKPILHQLAFSLEGLQKDLKSKYFVSGRLRLTIEEDRLREAFEHVMGCTDGREVAHSGSQVQANYAQIKSYVTEIINGKAESEAVRNLLVENTGYQMKSMHAWHGTMNLLHPHMKKLVALNAMLDFLDEQSAEHGKPRQSEKKSKDLDEKLKDLIEKAERAYFDVLNRFRRVENLLLCIHTASIVPVILDEKRVNAMTVFLTTNNRGQKLIEFDITKAISIRHDGKARDRYSRYWLDSVSQCSKWGVKNKETALIQSCFNAFVQGSQLEDFGDWKSEGWNKWLEDWARAEIIKKNSNHSATTRQFSKFWPTYFRVGSMVAASAEKSGSRRAMLQEMGADDYSAKWIESFLLRFEAFDRRGVVEDLVTSILLVYEWKEITSLLAALEIAVTRVYIFQDNRTDLHKPDWHQISGFILHQGVPAHELLEYIVEFTMMHSGLASLREKLSSKAEGRYRHWEDSTAGWKDKQFSYILYELYNMLNSSSWWMDLTRTISDKNPEVEHVLPVQRLKNATVKSRFARLDLSWQAQFSSYEEWWNQVNDLGNLTLVPKAANSRMSNYAYSKKRPHLLGLGDKFNAELVAIGHTNWGLAERDAWREKLVDWMLQRWSFDQNEFNSGLIDVLKQQYNGRPWKGERSKIDGKKPGKDSIIGDVELREIRDNWRDNCGELYIASGREMS